MEMGILSNIGRGIANVKRSICRGIGKVLENVGTVTHIWPVTGFGIDLQWSNPYLEKQIDLESTDASIQDTIDVHRACEKTRNDAAKQAKPFEDKMVDGLQEEINDFIDELAKIVPEDVLYDLNYGVGDAFENDIHNTVSEYVATHISQDSEEFVKILNMDDSIRAEKTDQYVKKVVKKAIEKVQEKCIRKEISIYKRMLDDLELYFTHERNYAEEIKRNIEELQKHKDDMAFYEEQAIQTVTDIAYMECIRTLTYSNSKP